MRACSVDLDMMEALFLELYEVLIKHGIEEISQVCIPVQAMSLGVTNIITESMQLVGTLGIQMVPDSIKMATTIYFHQKH